MSRLDSILSHNLPMTFTFAQVFLAALCFYFLVHSITCLAEIIHLKRTINEVPEPLREKITLAQHAKAAHYDIARTKLNWLEVTVTTVLIVYLTAGNGINSISDWLINAVGDQFAFHWMLPSCVGFIFVLCDLPFCWYKEFRLREAFGYTRQDPKAWFKNYVLTTLLGWLIVLPILWIGLFLWQNSGRMWWLLGWLIFAVYLVFSLNLARRLVYFFKPNRARLSDNAELKAKLDSLGEKARLSIGEIRVAKVKDNEYLPPAFAFGHRQNVKLFFRHDVYERMTLTDLQAIAAHALARNLSHMYFQAWFMCAVAGFFVFAFLAWFAPQSWFLDEIGFRVYGPGPYYGSVLTFTIVALPVLLFPFRLPMDAFLRHLIFASDTFAMKFSGLNATVHSLIELFPSPMRHSSVTLGFFDLLFSHEPSLMSRIQHVQRKSEVLDAARQEAAMRNGSLTVLHQLENVSSALISKQEQKVKEAEARDARRHALNKQFEKALVKKAHREAAGLAPLSTAEYKDPHFDDAMKNLSASNASHPMYGKSFAVALSDIWNRLKALKKSSNDSQELIKDSAPALTKAPSQPVEAINEESADVAEVNRALSTSKGNPFEVIDIAPAKPVTLETESKSDSAALALSETNDRSTAQDEVHENTSPNETGETLEVESTSTAVQDVAVETETPLISPVSNADEVISDSSARTEEKTESNQNTVEKENEQSLQTDVEAGIKLDETEVPLFGKASRRAVALKIMAQRQRELFAKTHPNAS